MKVKILYPENKLVDEITIIQWAQDVWDTAPIQFAEDRPTTLDSAKQLLEDEGVVTFSSQADWLDNLIEDELDNQ